MTIAICDRARQVYDFSHSTEGHVVLPVSE